MSAIYMHSHAERGNESKTYFGLEVYDDIENYVLESDIKNLPFYNFWKESARGTTCLMLNEDSGVFLHDWENFCKLFIESGKVIKNV